MKFNRVDLLPLKFTVLYVVFTVLLSFYGPVIYKNYDKLTVAIYMAGFLFLFSLGYIFGISIRQNGLSLKVRNSQPKSLVNILLLTKICISLFVLFQFITLIYMISTDSLDFKNYNIGAAYYSLYKNYTRGTGNVSMLFLFQTIFYPAQLVSLILGGYYFKKFPNIFKGLVVLSFISIILLNVIAHGKQQSLGLMIVILLVIFTLKTDFYCAKNRRTFYKRSVFFIILASCLFFLILHFRYSVIHVNAVTINHRINPLMKVDNQNIFYYVFGPTVGFSAIMLSTYLTQGYYGLSLSMKIPFVWTYFVGNSYSLTIFLQKYLGFPVSVNTTYPYRVGANSVWGQSHWSSIFAWFAGDFTFFGTLLFFSFIAYLYGKLWKEAYYSQRPISIILFVMFTFGVLMIPANNQLLLTPGCFLAVFLFLFLRKFSFKVRKSSGES